MDFFSASLLAFPALASPPPPPPPPPLPDPGPWIFTLTARPWLGAGEEAVLAGGGDRLLAGGDPSLR